MELASGNRSLTLRTEYCMKIKSLLTGLVALMMIGGFLATPTVASAQSQASRHRQKTKNEWRNAAYAGAGLAALGLLKHDSTLTFVGAAGALYSADRYEHDRKSQSKIDRARAQMFARSSFTRNGHSYRRYTTTKNGKKYYYFKRVNPGAIHGKKKGWYKNGKRK